MSRRRSNPVHLLSLLISACVAPSLAALEPVETADARGRVERHELRWSSGAPSLVDERLRAEVDLMQYLEWKPEQLPQILQLPGSYQGGPAVHVLLTDFVGDERLEILATGLAEGPLYAFDEQGAALRGWEGGVATPNGGASYPVALVDWPAQRGIVSATFRGDLALFSAEGQPAWLAEAANFVSSPPAVALPGRYTDFAEPRLHLAEEDRKVHGRDLLTGLELPGWPAAPQGVSPQDFHTPALADLDGDGALEVVSATGWSSSGGVLIAADEDGAVQWLEPLANVNVNTFPVIGDLDGNGSFEIVVLTRMTSSPWHSIVEVRSADGHLRWSYPLSDLSAYGTAPALANLDAESAPEIVIQLEHGVHVIDPFVGYFPGWPITLTTPSGAATSQGNSAPVVGDIDGDQLPEIVVTARGGELGTGLVFVLESDGSQLLPATPLPMGSGAVPAIGDVDRDGNNEIVIGSSYWVGTSGWYDSLWMFDLSRHRRGPAHGRIEWGQFMGNARHTGFYPWNLRELQ